MARTRKDELRIAHHEAGHAVMALWYGFSIHEATIVPGHGFAGLVRGEPQEGFERAFCHRLIVSMSGPAAEAEFTGEVPPVWEALLGAEGDVARVIALLRPLIRKKWDAIETVAYALVEKKTMTGQEIGRLIAFSEAVNRAVFRSKLRRT